MVNNRIYLIFYVYNIILFCDTITSSGRYILFQFKDTNYNPLNGLVPKKMFISCLLLSAIVTMYSEVSLIFINKMFLL